jgi:hypothetical protein
MISTLSEELVRAHIIFRVGHQLAKEGAGVLRRALPMV